jgi:hypothetical protein
VNKLQVFSDRGEDSYTKYTAPKGRSAMISLDKNQLERSPPSLMRRLISGISLRIVIDSWRVWKVLHSNATTIMAS